MFETDSRSIPVDLCDVQGLELKDGDLCTMEGMTQKFLGEEGVVVGSVSSQVDGAIWCASDIS